MARRRISVFFLLVLFASVRTEAREGKSFIHYTNTAGGPTIAAAPTTFFTPAPAPAPVEAPATSPVDVPAPAPQISEGYGLYGIGSEENAATATIGDDGGDGEFPSEELGVQSYEERGNDQTYPSYSSNNNNGGYKGREYDSTRYPYNSGGNNGKLYGNGNNVYYSDRHRGNGYVGQGRQGMSDTRFLENGRYFLDVNNADLYQNNNGYDSVRETGNVASNEKSQFEFDTMEEYERQQGNQQSQGEYLP